MGFVLSPEGIRPGTTKIEEEKFSCQFLLTLCAQVHGKRTTTIGIDKIRSKIQMRARRTTLVQHN